MHFADVSFIIGHFNPAITICFAIWQGFPWKKVPHYIFAQIFGSFMAGLLVMGMYWPEIQAAKAIDLATEGTVHFNGGVASILCTYPNANQTNQGYLFLQEWFVDSYIVSCQQRSIFECESIIGAGSTY
jgi:glycerol uptake facilitator-like aquaporin